MQISENMLRSGHYCSCSLEALGGPSLQPPWMLLNGKHEHRDLGGVLNAVAWKGGEVGLSLAEHSHSPVPGNPMQRPLQWAAELRWAPHPENTTLNFPVTPPKLPKCSICFSETFLTPCFGYIIRNTSVFSKQRAWERSCVPGLALCSFLPHLRSSKSRVTLYTLPHLGDSCGSNSSY